MIRHVPIEIEPCLSRARASAVAGHNANAGRMAIPVRRDAPVLGDTEGDAARRHAQALLRKDAKTRR